MGIAVLCICGVLAKNPINNDHRQILTLNAQELSNFYWPVSHLLNLFTQYFVLNKSRTQLGYQNDSQLDWSCMV